MAMVRGLETLIGRLADSIRSEIGAVATEYALILTLIAIATILGLTLVGIAVGGLFDQAPPAFPGS